MKKGHMGLLAIACLLTGLIMIFFDMKGWGWAIGLGFVIVGFNDDDHDA